jgi:LacI family transcriptional regulator
MRVNLEEVARLAGVSRSTVSRVVNDDPRVSDPVRERVQGIIRQHNYHPYAAARSLASRRTRILGLLIPHAASALFNDPFFPRLIQGAVDGCNAADHHLMMLMHSSSDPMVVERTHHRVIHGHHLDGLVIASSVVDDPLVTRLTEENYPFVLIGRHPRYRQISSVDVDNRAAAQSAVAHLLEHGYQRIAFIGGLPNMIAAIDRYGGYVTALQEAGVLPDPTLAVHGDFTQEGGYRAMQTLLAHQPDAVFVASDTMALGAIQAAHDAGCRVPDDVAIAGYDNILASATSQPPLTTINQPIGDLGRVAVETLIERIENPEAGPICRLLSTRLILRRSCGCAPMGGDAGIA